MRKFLTMAAVVMGVALGAIATPLTAGVVAYFYNALKGRA